MHKQKEKSPRHKGGGFKANRLYFARHLFISRFDDLSIHFCKMEHELHRNRHQKHQHGKHDEGNAVSAKQIEAKIGKRGTKRKARGAGRGKHTHGLEKAFVSEQLACKQW